MLCTERKSVSYDCLINARDPSSARWDTIIDILKRIVQQSRAVDVLLSQETIASVVPILPSIPEPFFALIEPFLSAFDSAMVPYDLEPLWQRLVSILVETEDDALLSQVLRVFRVLFFQKITPPLSVQPDLYRKFKQLVIDNNSLVGETRLNAFGFKAGLITLLGIEFLANPPVIDPTAKGFARLLIFADYNDLDKNFANECLRDPHVAHYLSFHLAILEATISFCFADNNDPFSPEEMREIYNLVTNKVSMLSTFLKSEYGVHDETSSTIPEMSPLVYEVLGCLLPWIAKGNVHKQNEQLLYTMTMYANVYQSYDDGDNSMIQALKGLNGLVEYTVDGSAEFLKWKDIWIQGFANILGTLAKEIPFPKSMVEISVEMIHLLRIMAQKQGVVMFQEQQVRQFPREFYKSIDKENWLELNGTVKHEAVVLAVELLLVRANKMDQKLNRIEVRNWKLKLKELQGHTPGEAGNSELDSLILALDQI